MSLRLKLDLIEENKKQLKNFNNFVQKHYLKIIIVLILNALFILKLIIYGQRYSMRFQMNQVVDYIEPEHLKFEKFKYILFWTNFYESEYWEMGGKVVGEEYLRSAECPVTNCIFSHDRELLPKLMDYDAFVFHVGEAFDMFDLPEMRNENQIYIMANQESPIFTKHNLKYDQNFFNMTMTYRLDSDVYWGYVRVSDIETGALVAPSKSVVWRKPEEVRDPHLLNFIKFSKTKPIAWFVSHCDAFSNRDFLAKKLQQFINVDIYGKCGNLTCPRFTGQCEQMLNSTYKFYLAFENSLCVDYITEKVFNSMQNFVVPIVYNGITDMSNFLPPHSYINVNDFGNVEDLVDYLKYLDENPQEYANYFWWKKYYKINDNKSLQSYCELCMKLNDWDVKEKRQCYNDIANWYNYRTCKDRPKHFQ